MDGILDTVRDCLQSESAFCTAACPFHFDVRDFAEKLQRGAFNSAYRAYLGAVGFPGIVSALCDESCAAACPRSRVDGAVSLRLLERASLDYARNLDPDSYNMPRKGRRVAVVGAGVSGLACALRLASRKYDVTVYEKAEAVGGHLYGLMPPQAFLADIERQFKNEDYELRLGTELASLDDLNSDAIYVATGSGGRDFGLCPDPGGAFASARSGVFMGGSLTGSGTMAAIADGLGAALAVERYLKTGAMNQPRGRTGTRLQLDVSRIVPADRVLPADGRAYTKDEALAEAKRCLRCSCDACVRSCDLMKFFQKTPRRIAEEVEITIHPGTLDGNGTVATRLISTCNQCGLCREVCPQGIDTGELLLHSHRAMREKGAMPWAFHDFFLRDMAFSNGEAALARPPRGFERASRLFFPGCQLGGSDPRYVTESYRFLLRHWPDTALALGCCGAPAEWAGDEKVRDEALAMLRAHWQALGEPELVFACPSCKKMIGRYLPGIRGRFLYDLLRERGAAPSGNAPAPSGSAATPSLSAPGARASVFDPCSSRGETATQKIVREIAQRAGYSLAPLPEEGGQAQCCSWGGQVSVAHPPYANYVARTRSSEGPDPYITYCANCRDVFAKAGKPAWHILDIVFGLNGADRPPPTMSERRGNRIELKRRLLDEFWGEGSEMSESGTRLVISAELRRKLSDELLLESDIAKVIEHCEQSGRKVLDPSTGAFSGHLRIGNMTYWVEYRPAPPDASPEGGFELLNAYSHRMSIEEN